MDKRNILSPGPKGRFPTVAAATAGALLAVVSAGLVIAQTSEKAGASSVPAALVQAVVGPGQQDAPVIFHPIAVHRGGAPWAGPVRADERQQTPRRLSDAERMELRQDIRTAGEEVYESYRNKKR
ncbi:hypothetical protein GCM10023144_34490 [Pigmentiphaga soli]|uniref:DUF4148 domain-containing protein n=1 Tax=Pigmentiphaga soli TaxID=1007095 RepID=A0ABP8HE87_9BURK